MKCAVTEHERTHSGEKPNSCRYCDYRVVRTCDVKPIHSHSGEKPYSCRYCDYQAAQMSDVTAHERIHSGEKPYSCRYCDYRAAANCSVMVHARTHSVFSAARRLTARLSGISQERCASVKSAVAVHERLDSGEQLGVPSPVVPEVRSVVARYFISGVFPKQSQPIYPLLSPSSGDQGRQ